MSNGVLIYLILIAETVQGTTLNLFKTFASIFSEFVAVVDVTSLPAVDVGALEVKEMVVVLDVEVSVVE